jgi:hypothetical protein
MCLVGTGFAEGEEAVKDEAAGFGVDVTIDFYSKYVWRGQNLVDDWVLQPGVSSTFGNFTLGVWGNVDMTKKSGILLKLTTMLIIART